MNNEVTLLIDGQDFRYWTDLEISRPIDSLSTFSMVTPFDQDDPILRAALAPFSYKPVEVKIDSEPLFTGVLFVSPDVAPSAITVTCAGYSKPGAMNDCEFPPEVYPLEFDGVDLEFIAAKAALPFGVDVVFNSPPGVVFDKVAAEPQSKALAFLIGLAKQRGLLVSDTPDGALVFFTPIESGPAVATIRQDGDRFLAGRPVFSDQQYYSSVTGLSSHVVARPAESFTVKNTLLPDVVRPHVFKIADTTDVDIQTVTRAKAGRMIADAVSYEITVQGWRDDLGDVWAPNKIVKLYAPGIMVYTETDFIIKEPKLLRSSDGGDTATLALVLPGSYNGKIPERLPWEL